ncbi:MAG TPA: HemK/PrmC family methyltransferase [Candidatus Binatia bacterium]|nr:HemK/PrmC family methyltransferase [Candidatus Binatia bacterium]
MTAGQFLRMGTDVLKANAVASARLDCLVLMEDCLNRDRAWLLAHPETKISTEQLRKLNKRLARRAKHEPLAYIRGFSEFYGRRFKVNKRVLEPRPESETMIDLLKKLPLGSKPAIADVGTGSGCLGITAALELHDPNIDLYDIDSAALAVARHNSVMHEVHLHAYKRDLLRRVTKSYDVILANLPYVPTTWKINEAAKAEPRLAIFGGKDGLDVYRRLFEQLAKLDKKPAFVLTESLPPQHQALIKIARTAGYRKLRSRDFIQVFSYQKS